MKKYLKYTWEHKKEFLRIEKEILSKNTINGYLHDIDKIVLYTLFYFINSEKLKIFITILHRKINAHHYRSNKLSEKIYTEMIIDWECARFTKLDKPLNAKETLYKHYPQLINNIEPLLKKYNLF